MQWKFYHLRARGDITIRFSRDTIKAEMLQKNGKRGVQTLYYTIAI